MFFFFFPFFSEREKLLRVVHVSKLSELWEVKHTLRYGALTAIGANVKSGLVQRSGEKVHEAMSRSRIGACITREAMLGVGDDGDPFSLSSFCFDLSLHGLAVWI